MSTLLLILQGMVTMKIVHCMDEMKAIADLKIIPMIATLRKFKGGMYIMYLKLNQLNMFRSYKILICKQNIK